MCTKYCSKPAHRTPTNANIRRHSRVAVLGTMGGLMKFFSRDRVRACATHDAILITFFVCFSHSSRSLVSEP